MAVTSGFHDERVATCPRYVGSFFHPAAMPLLLSTDVLQPLLSAPEGPFFPIVFRTTT